MIIVRQKFKNTILGLQILPTLLLFIFLFFIASLNYCTTKTSTDASSGSVTATATGGVITITTPPVNAIVLPATTAIFKVAATTNNGSPLTYQWQMAHSGSTNFTNIIDATGVSYKVERATDTGSQYRVIISAVGIPSVISPSATLTISSIGIISHPTDYTVQPVTLVKFSVIAVTSHGGILTYQWQKAPSGSNTFTNIIGVTNTSYNYIFC